ncbi:MAG: hypothetical protein AVDCRST_MAG90-3336, partial [uncultured Microvirga sp.]
CERSGSASSYVRRWPCRPASPRASATPRPAGHAAPCSTRRQMRQRPSRLRLRRPRPCPPSPCRPRPAHRPPPTRCIRRRCPRGRLSQTCRRCLAAPGRSSGCGRRSSLRRSSRSPWRPRAARRWSAAGPPGRPRAVAGCNSPPRPLSTSTRRRPPAVATATSPASRPGISARARCFSTNPAARSRRGCGRPAAPWRASWRSRARRSRWRA